MDPSCGSNATKIMNFSGNARVIPEILRRGIFPLPFLRRNPLILSRRLPAGGVGGRRVSSPGGRFPIGGRRTPCFCYTMTGICCSSIPPVLRETSSLPRGCSSCTGVVCGILVLSSYLRSGNSILKYSSMYFFVSIALSGRMPPVTIVSYSKMVLQNNLLNTRLYAFP